MRGICNSIWLSDSGTEVVQCSRPRLWRLYSKSKTQAHAGVVSRLASFLQTGWRPSFSMMVLTSLHLRSDVVKSRDSSTEGVTLSRRSSGRWASWCPSSEFRWRERSGGDWDRGKNMRSGRKFLLDRDVNYLYDKIFN